MAYSDVFQISEDIKDYIIEKVRELDNYTYKELLMAISCDISDMLEALEDDESINLEE